jgi:tetratricopeptide (TPR) repeat protein
MEAQVSPSETSGYQTSAQASTPASQSSLPSSQLPTQTTTQAANQASQSSQASSLLLQTLLERARGFEVRGRIDMAVPTWRQILLVDPNNAEATAGLSRASRLEGGANTAQNHTAPDRLAHDLPASPLQTNSQQTPQVASAGTRSSTERLAYEALNDRRLDQAEALFQIILQREPDNPRALAGMGYIRMQQGNFMGTISFLEQASRDEAGDAGLIQALDTARFWFHVGEGQTALTTGDLTGAEKEYNAALHLRPDSAEALSGLARTLIRTQQPVTAIPLFDRVVRANPASSEGWRGLVQAQAAAGEAAQALATDGQEPAAVHAQLSAEPQYLRALAAAYSAAGRDADAVRTLESALRLADPADAKTSDGKTRIDTEIQLADMLLATNRLQQSMTLYAQALAADHANTAAWRGLVRVQHALGRDAQAMLSVESMPPASYAVAMRDTAFEVTVASVYQEQKKFDVAEDLLEKALAQQTSTGQKTSPGVELQLASLYAARGDAKLAVPIYQRIVDGDATLSNAIQSAAWDGLVDSLHATGDDKQALAEVQKIPPAPRAALDRNASFLQTLVSLYAANGQSRQAAATLDRVQQLYVAQKAAAPADLDIQNAWLLYNGLQDASLFRQLLELGGRSDLTVEQTRAVETIWTNWAVRRAGQLTAAGNSRFALAVLNAAARAFPDNPAVLKILANGYAQAGEADKAVAIYKALNLSSASVADYQAAVGAALSAGDKIAETWLRSAQTAFPNDPQILLLSARFEQSRGNTNRAIDLYHASLKAMPATDPGTELAAQLHLPAPNVPSRLPSADEQQDLSILLAPGSPIASGLPLPGSTPDAKSLQPHVYDIPYTPPAASTLGRDATDGSNGGANSGANHVVPPYMTNPKPTDAAPAPDAQPKGGAPQSRVEQLQPDAVEPVVLLEPAVHGQTAQAVTMTNVVAFRMGDTTPHPAQPQTELTDVLPTARYVSNARASQTISSHPDIAAAQAASIRRHQSDTSGVRTGQSHPPSEETIAADEQEAQYISPVQLNNVSQQSGSPAQIMAQNHIPQSPQSQSTQGQTAQLARPAARPTGSSGKVPDTGAQQYPRPHSFPGPASRSAQSSASSRTSAAQNYSYEPTAPASAPASISLGAAEDLSISEPQRTEQSVQMGDSNVSCSVPPPWGGGYYSGGYYDSQAPAPLTARQQASGELSTLESLYSGWLGGSGVSRYRNGTAGLDKLYDNEAPIELSTVLGRTTRLTATATPVFLNSGTLATSIYAGSSVPFLGTLTGSSTGYPPPQQLANGIGGELQLTSRNFGIAAGYTPYNFLIQNITGHARWSLFRQHLTLFGDRDAVKDTQLSYAGLRDPGSITPFYVGHGWGGVVASTAGARIDFASNGSGFFFSGGGGILHGYHVQNNSKAEASMGGYFRLKDWPAVGSLTLGASLYATHFHYNESGLTFGQGGYFSPNYYYIASVPLTFAGSPMAKLHYAITGSVGAQSYDQDWNFYFPIDPSLQSSTEITLGCTVAQIAAHSCGEIPVTGDTSVHYSFNALISYRVGEHWNLGGFVAANNENNYNSVSGGFSFRYAFRRQESAQGARTGQFPTTGFRPLQTP